MTAVTVLALALSTPTAAPNAPDARETVAKGLKWLAEKQNKDGTWSANGDFLKVNVTSYAGLALLMQGSTLQDGPFAENLRKTVAWFEKIAQPNGLLVPADDPTEQGRYMQSHTAALLFLASACDADGDGKRRERLAKLLDAAVKFAIDGQTRRGGWGFVSPRERETDDTSATVFMVQALRAAERAGAQVPRAVYDRAAKYLTDATGRDGGLTFAPGTPGSGLRVPRTAQLLPTAAGGAAVAALDRRLAALAQWVGYTKRALLPLPQDAAARPDLYSSNAMQQHLAAARLAHALGENGHRSLDPDAGDGDLLRWAQHRERLFPFLKAAQSSNGSWEDQFIGPVYNTALALIALQLDNEYLPAFSR